MMRCPLCRASSHTRCSRYVTEQVKEAYYQCTNLECSATFKTNESFVKFITRPPEPEKVIVPPPEPSKRQTLNRYGSAFRSH